MMAERFPKSCRLSPPRAVARVFDEGRSASDRLMRVYALEAPDRNIARVAVAVGRRHGSAVGRNRVKRVCREALRAVRAQLPTGWDFVVMPHAGKELSIADLGESIVQLARKVTDSGGGD